MNWVTRLTHLGAFASVATLLYARGSSIELHRTISCLSEMLQPTSFVDCDQPSVRAVREGSRRTSSAG